MEAQATDPVDFAKVQFVKLIDESRWMKSITFLARYEQQDMVIRLEKSPFDPEAVKKALNGNQIKKERNLCNDIYSRYKLIPDSESLNELKAILVSPADEKVVTKYSRNEAIFFSETPTIYQKVVEPYLNRMASEVKDYNRWIYNILDGKSEADHVILNHVDGDDGFMLLPSLKSSGDDKELHIIAICHRRDIKSLRDLTAEHLTLLGNIRDKSGHKIRECYPNCEGQLRAYIHYHPTFYHFHVHFEMVDPSEYRSSDRDNLLTTVIDNISNRSDYYQKAILTYPLSKASALYKELDLSGSFY